MVIRQVDEGAHVLGLQSDALPHRKGEGDDQFPGLLGDRPDALPAARGRVRHGIVDDHGVHAEATIFRKKDRFYVEWYLESNRLERL